MKAVGAVAAVVGLSLLEAAQIVPFPTPPPGARKREMDPVVDTTVEAVAGGLHNRQSVRIRGLFTPLGVERLYHEMKDGTDRVLVIVVPDLHRDAPIMLGRRVEVTGLVRELEHQQGTCRFLAQEVPRSFCLDPDLPPTPDLSGHVDWPRVSVTIWSIIEEARPFRRPEKGSLLGSLLGSADDGSDVVVSGRFCGRGLCGPEPGPAPHPRAWLLQDGDAAVWVRGKDPKGKGWSLDPAYAGDASKWLEVEGRLERCGEAWCLKARKLALTAPPAGADPPSP